MTTLPRVNKITRIAHLPRFDLTWRRHIDVEIMWWMACLAVRMLWLLVGKLGEESEGMGMDRFQLTVRREICPANVALCPCPLDRGTG